MRWRWWCGILDWVMNSKVPALTRQYAGALRHYVEHQRETLLQQAYELGRKASAEGLGVLDMARIHQQALASCLRPISSAAKGRDILKAAETFFLEMLSPFEAAHRGFRQANLRLHQLNDVLEERNEELRRSREHYRVLFNQASVMQENLRSLSNQILHAQEEERKRISRELHDEVGQALTAVNTNLSLLQRNGALHGESLKKRICDAQGLLEQTMEAVHRFARELRPAMLDELGLLPALRSYLKCFAERTGLRVRFQGSRQAEELDEEKKTVVFRVTQESLTNVAKHARASQVAVSLRKLRHGVEVQIKDDGEAFEVEQQLGANGKKRLGLLGMQERVRLVNGRFAIKSAPGKGTTVRVEIPSETGDICKK
jgi:two-component system sensor histidine kinase DegS